MTTWLKFELILYAIVASFALADLSTILETEVAEHEDCAGENANKYDPRDSLVSRSQFHLMFVIGEKTLLLHMIALVFEECTPWAIIDD